MASASRDPDGDGVRFVHEDDGRVTAVDEETGVASFGDTKAEALRMLAEALELHEGGGEPVTEEDLAEWGLDAHEAAGEPDELPDFMQ
jgi:predicted RNase H-like HicB family nuclease